MRFTKKILIFPIICVLTIVISLSSFFLCSKPTVDKLWKPTIIQSSNSFCLGQINEIKLSIIESSIPSYISDDALVWDNYMYVNDQYLNVRTGNKLVTKDEHAYKLETNIGFRNEIIENQNNFSWQTTTFEFGINVNEEYFYGRQKWTAYRINFKILSHNQSFFFNLSISESTIDFPNNNGGQVTINCLSTEKNDLRYNVIFSNHDYDDLFTFQTMNSDIYSNNILLSFDIDKSSSTYHAAFWNSFTFQIRFWDVVSMESSVKIVTISVNSFDINSHLDSITLTSNKTYIDFDSDNNDSILITLNGGVLGLENLNIQPLALPNEFSNILQLNLIDESNNILNYELSFKSTASSLAWATTNINILFQVNYGIKTLSVTVYSHSNPQVPTTINLTTNISTLNYDNRTTLINANVVQGVGSTTWNVQSGYEQYVNFSIDGNNCTINYNNFVNNDSSIYITASNNGIIAGIYILLEKRPNTSINLTTNKTTLSTIGETSTIVANIAYPEGSTTFTISDTNNLSYEQNDNQLVITYTSHVANNTTITVTCENNNISSTIQITLEKNLATNVSLSADKYIASNINEEIIITPTVENPVGDNEWFFNNDNIFSVISQTNNQLKIKYINWVTNQRSIQFSVRNNGIMASINITFKPEPITEITSTISQTAFTSTNQTITINYSIINPVGNTEFIIDDQANIYWQNNEVSANNYIATIRYDTYVAIAKTINITISNNNVVKQYAISLCTNPNPEYTVTFSSTGTVLNKNGTTSITITAVVLKDNVVDTGHQNLFSWDSDFPIPSNIYKLSNYNTILEKNITVSQTNSTCKISIKNSNLPTWGWLGSSFQFGGTLSNNSSVIKKASINLNEYQLSNDSYYQYIFDRTFAIAQWRASECAMGTAWIYKRISNYKYRIFTNIHVRKGLEEVRDDAPFIDVFGTASLYTSNANINDTNSRTPGNYPAGSYYAFQNKEIVWRWSSKSGNYALGDFACGDVDFGSSPSADMKSRLDAINSNFGTNPCISFRQVPIKQNEFSYSYQRMWAAGYPFIYDGGDTTHFTKKCAEIDHINLHTSANVGHNTDDGNDIADEYVAKTGQMDIGPGASGSMVIDRFGEVIGIYWGKYYNSSNNWGAADILISDGFGSHSSYNIIDNNPYK